MSAVSPKRIQRKRTKGWRMPEGAVYVGRPTLWGNPWTPADAPDFLPRRERVAWAVRAYERELDHLGLLSDYGYISEGRADKIRADLHARGCSSLREYAALTLAGADLACWCPLDATCHADVLLQIANAR